MYWNVWCYYLPCISLDIDEESKINKLNEELKKWLPDKNVKSHVEGEKQKQYVGDKNPPQPPYSGKY